MEKKLKKFFSRHSKLFGFMFGTMLSLILVGGSALAYTSWQTSSALTGATGSITVVDPAPTPDYNYTLSTNTLNFSLVGTAITGQEVTVMSQTVIVTNTGNQPIHGITVNMVSPPAGLTGVTVSYQGSSASSGVVANDYQFNIIIKGTPPTAGVYNYSGFSCTITPN